MATHSSTLAWKIPWTEEPGRLQSMGSLRVRHNWATSLSLFTFMHWRRKWQPTPVFLPGESQGQGSLVGCCLWGRTESDMTEATQQQQQQHLLQYDWCPYKKRRLGHRLTQERPCEGTNHLQTKKYKMLKNAHLYFFSFLLYIGVQPINNAVTVPSGQQRDSAIHIHVSTLPQTPLQSRLPHNIEQSSTCSTVEPCWFSVLNTAVCTCLPQTP